MIIIFIRNTLFYSVIMFIISIKSSFTLFIIFEIIINETELSGQCSILLTPPAVKGIIGPLRSS